MENNRIICKNNSYFLGKVSDTWPSGPATVSRINNVALCPKKLSTSDLEYSAMRLAIVLEFLEIAIASLESLFSVYLF